MLQFFYTLSHFDLAILFKTRIDHGIITCITAGSFRQKTIKDEIKVT